MTRQPTAVHGPVAGCCQAPPHPALALPHTCLILHYYTASWSTRTQLAPPGAPRERQPPPHPVGPAPATSLPQMQGVPSERSNRHRASPDAKPVRNKASPSGRSLTAQPRRGPAENIPAAEIASESTPGEEATLLARTCTPNAQGRKCRIRLGLNRSLVASALPHERSRM